MVGVFGKVFIQSLPEFGDRIGMGLQEGGDVRNRGGDRPLGLDQGQIEPGLGVGKLDMIINS